jgi:hypothetical protein
MCSSWDQTKLTALLAGEIHTVRNANCQHGLSPSLPLTSILLRAPHCKSLPRLTRAHVAIFLFGVSHSPTADMSPILTSFVSYISKSYQSTERMHSLSPSLSRLILRKESSAPFGLPLFRILAWCSHDSHSPLSRVHILFCPL